MSVYQQPFTQADIKDGTKILATRIDIGGSVRSCSFVNSTAYWFNVKNKAGDIVTFIGPNTKGNENFTLEVSDYLLVNRDLTLAPVTSAVSTDIFYIRFNNDDGTAGMSDYNTSTALGSNAAQDVILKAPLPAGNNTIGTVGLASGTAKIGTVSVDTLPDVGIKSGQSVNVGSVTTLPDVGIKAGQSVNVGSVTTLPDVGIKAGQSVNVGTMPDVGLKAGQSVNIGNFPVTQEVRLKGQNMVIPQPSAMIMVTTLTVATVNTDTAIPGKTNGPFVFRADPKNQGTIYFGPVGSVAFPLEPGAAIDGYATWGAGELVFKGETVGDKLYLLGGVY